jgi:hypothetical protein
MRVASPLLTLSALLVAVPALAQGGSYYDPGSPYDRQSMNQDHFDRYEYYPPPQGQNWQGQPWQGQPWQGQPWQGPMNQGRWQQGQMQPGSMQEMMQQHHRQLHQEMQGNYPQQTGPSQMGQMDQSTRSPVSSATQGQIKNSLEASGFKNVMVQPQSYLIRATAPDGSHIIMQVSSDSLYGVIVTPPQATSSSGTAGTSATGSTSSGSGAASGASGTGSTNSGSGAASGASGTGNTNSGSGDTSGTGPANAGGSTNSTGQATAR